MDKADEAMLEEARERFDRGLTADTPNRAQATEDLAFYAGDQWDEGAKAFRVGQRRPVLTLNRFPQFVGQVIGDIRQNKPSIKVRPHEDEDIKIADARQGLIRTIEQKSNASSVYALAAEDQVACGLGWFRVSPEYEGDDGFHQTLKISGGGDPLAVVWDPQSLDPTGEDADWCFVSDMIPRKEFEARYPGKTPSSMNPDVYGARMAGLWVTNDQVRITEYWRMERRPYTIYRLANGETVAELPEGEQPVAQRTAYRRRATMRLITGFDVLDDGPYEAPLSRLPIIRVNGREVRINNTRYRYGLIRFAKDAARLKNASRSVALEALALAPKSQWLAGAQQIEGYEAQFREAHISGDPLLVWSGQGEQPQRVMPPPMPTAFMEMAQVFEQDTKDITGLHDASLGAQSNETSGKAIMARERQGDVATFIYVDNLHSAIEAGGRVINEWIDDIYAEPRTVLTTQEDGSTQSQRINDEADEKSVPLTQGKYHVTIDVGPSYTTKRVEAADSMLQFMQAVPGSAQFVGDLVAKAQDWPMAEQFADRLQMALPPQIQAKIAEEKNGGQPIPPPAPPPPDPMQVELAKAALSKAQAETLKAHAEVETEQAKTKLTAAQAEKALFEIGQLNGQALASLSSEVVGDQEQPAPDMGPDLSGQPPSPVEPPAQSDASPTP